MINTQTASPRKSSNSNIASGSGSGNGDNNGDANDGDTITGANPSSKQSNETGSVPIYAASNQVFCHSESSGNKIFITNVIENSVIEMNDGTESNTNNTYNVCGSDSNNSLGCNRNGMERTATTPSSTGSAGTMRSSDSSTCTAGLVAGANSHHLSPAASSLSPIQLSPCRSMDSVNDDELDEIGKLFENKTKLIERWLREKASPDILSRIHTAADYARVPKSPKRTSSVTSDLFQMWLASSSPVQVSSSAAAGSHASFCVLLSSVPLLCVARRPSILYRCLHTSLDFRACNEFDIDSIPFRSIPFHSIHSISPETMQHKFNKQIYSKDFVGS